MHVELKLYYTALFLTKGNEMVDKNGRFRKCLCKIPRTYQLTCYSDWHHFYIVSSNLFSLQLSLSLWSSMCLSATLSISFFAAAVNISWWQFFDITTTHRHFHQIRYDYTVTNFILLHNARDGAITSQYMVAIDWCGSTKFCPSNCVCLTDERNVISESCSFHFGNEFDVYSLQLVNRTEIPNQGKLSLNRRREQIVAAISSFPRCDKLSTNFSYLKICMFMTQNENGTVLFTLNQYLLSFLCFSDEISFSTRKKQHLVFLFLMYVCVPGVWVVCILYLRFPIW